MYLVGTTIFDAITNSRGKLEKLYTNLSTLLPDFPFTLQEFLFCSMAVQTRSFQLDSFSLVPYADLLNHNESPNVRYKFEDNQFVLRATRDI